MQRPQREDIIDAHERIKELINKTPVLEDQKLNDLIGATVYFKCENLQNTGSFKVRGATNNILQLNDIKKIITCSCGNHGKAVAYIGRKLGLPTTVVMPGDSLISKQNAVKQQGATVLFGGNTYAEVEKIVLEIVEKDNAVYVPSSNHIYTITGNSTVSYELYTQLSHRNIELDYLLFPIGGGGLASGSILSTKYFSPNTKTIGVQPQLDRDAYLSWKEKKYHEQLPPLTIADGLRVRLCQKAFPIVSQQIDQIILVTDHEMIDATKLYMQTTKQVLQTSSASVVAALLKDPRFKGKKVGAIISGGNIDLLSFFQDLHNQVKQ